jgi:hypothetical protein
VARQRQETAAINAQYAQRAAVEGTHSQGVRRGGLRRARSIGLAKTHLQHLITAVALNVVRLGEWWPGTPRVGMLPYNVTVTLYLASVGVAGGLSGLLLWPVVVLHVILTALLTRAFTRDQEMNT